MISHSTEITDLMLPLHTFCQQKGFEPSRHGLHKTPEAFYGIWHQDVSNRSFKHCKLWGWASIDQTCLSRTSHRRSGRAPEIWQIWGQISTLSPIHTTFSRQEYLPLPSIWKSQRQNGKSFIPPLIHQWRYKQSHNRGKTALVWMEKPAAWDRGLSDWCCSQSDS